MDKTLLELLKEAKEKEAEKMNRSQEQKTKDRQQIFNAGFQMGIQYMMDKIERQYQLGKPILANDNLYWLKGAKENLRDIMDDIEAEYNAEMKKNE
jgi:hypothetical protein